MNQELIFWVVAAIVLALVEASTANLVSIWFAAGALAAAIGAGLGASLWAEIVLFVAVSAAVLLFTKPLVKKIRGKEAESTNADRIIGKEAVVLEEIDPVSGQGQIRVLGQVWSAKSDKRIEAGKAVTVAGIAGVKAVVEEKEEA